MCVFAHLSVAEKSQYFSVKAKITDKSSVTGQIVGYFCRFASAQPWQMLQILCISFPFMFNTHLCETAGFFLTEIALCVSTGYEIFTENDKNSTHEVSRQ